MAVQLYLLGGFRATDASGGAFALPTEKAEALIAYLALNTSTAHYREKLATLLWGASPDSHARASLRQALSRARKAWPANEPLFLETESKKLALDPAAVVVDVATFERYAMEATPAALEAAADQYRGDLLDGVRIEEEDFEDWLRQERTRLHELATGVLRRLLDHYAGTGAIERGVSIANRLLAFDPYQESVQRTLIRFYLYQKRRPRRRIGKGSYHGQFHAGCHPRGAWAPIAADHDQTPGCARSRRGARAHQGEWHQSA